MTSAHSEETRSPAGPRLGPITAMNGVLLFAWSTALIFEVPPRTLARSSIFRSEERLSLQDEGLSPGASASHSVARQA